MALLSFAGAPHGGSLKLLPEWQSQPTITPTTIIDHSIVGSAANAWWYFHDSTGIESHFIVHQSGLIWQLMDTGRQADANLNANRFALSIETEDDGDPDTQPWTRAQLESLAWLHNKLVAVHPSIPRRLCPSEAGGGLGYHTLFGAPSAWTPVAKSCPGAVRKRQWRDVLLPAFLTGQQLQEDDMTVDELRAEFAFGGDATVRSAVKELARDALQEEFAKVGGSVREDLKSTSRWGAANAGLPTADQVAAAVVAALPPGVDLTPQQLADLGKAVADNLEVAGHPTLKIVGTAEPMAAPGG